MADVVQKWLANCTVVEGVNRIFHHHTVAEDVTSTYTYINQYENVYPSGTALETVPIASGDILVVMTNTKISLRFDGSAQKVIPVDKMLVIDFAFSTLEIAVAATEPPAKVKIISLFKGA